MRVLSLGLALILDNLRGLASQGTHFAAKTDPEKGSGGPGARLGQKRTRTGSLRALFRAGSKTRFFEDQKGSGGPRARLGHKRTRKSSLRALFRAGSKTRFFEASWEPPGASWSFLEPG